MKAAVSVMLVAVVMAAAVAFNPDALAAQLSKLVEKTSTKVFRCFSLNLFITRIVILTKDLAGQKAQQGYHN